MASLQDQLSGAGLINKKKAKRIKAEKLQAEKKNRQANVNAENEAASLAEQARIQQQKRSQELNKQQKQEAEKKAIAAQVRQLIELNSVKIAKDDSDKTIAYNFTDDNKIKTLHVLQKSHDLISRGHLAIVKLEETYHVIPTEAAKKIKERDSDSIILLNDFSEAEGEVSEDDPYAEYQVPDDLMW